MKEYQSNSHKSKEERAAAETTTEKRVEKVVSGNVKTRDNKARKFADIFISEDAANVKSYVFMDVLVPAIKKAISDIVTDGIDMVLYGSTGGSRRKSSGGGNKVSYRSYYDDRPRDRRDEHVARTRFEYDDIIFESRTDAERVRMQMFDTIKRYGYVTVADMYDLADLSAPYTGYNYGWTNIRTSEVQSVRDGYVLRLPIAMPID